MSCKKNPRRVKHYHSPDSGAQEGCESWSKGKKVGTHPKWKKLFPLDKVLVANSTYSRVCIRRRILEEKLISYECKLCGLGPSWHGKTMPLILDHENGINNDNRLENLRFVCSNCDSTLPTYKSRNRK